MKITLSREIYEEALLISRDLWLHPEISGEEFRSSKMLAERIAAHGFRVTMPVCGMETAFLAEWPAEPPCREGQHVPTVAFLAEYDALPGYGDLSPDGSGNAHACGHNWISAVAFGAAAALKEAVVKAQAEEGLPPVRILLLGTPAEETWGAKVTMEREGYFRTLDMDAAFECHLSGQPKHCFDNFLLALTDMQITFHGKASHAAAHPENGINALDALNLTFAGIACMRQHVLPSTKMHGMVLEGGRACNIIPDTASMEYYVRAAKKDYMEQLVERVGNCARGAALMTGCEAEIVKRDNVFYDMKNNGPLNRRAEQYLKEAAAEAGRPEEGELREDNVFTAPSGDIGNVSYCCPAFYGVFSTAPESGGADIHDADYLKVTDSEKAHGLIRLAAEVIANTGMDVLADPGFRAAMKKDF